MHYKFDKESAIQTKPQYDYRPRHRGKKDEQINSCSTMVAMFLLLIRNLEYTRIITFIPPNPIRLSPLLPIEITSTNI